MAAGCVDTICAPTAPVAAVEVLVPGLLVEVGPVSEVAPVTLPEPVVGLVGGTIAVVPASVPAVDVGGVLALDALAVGGVDDDEDDEDDDDDEEDDEDDAVELDALDADDEALEEDDVLPESEPPLLAARDTGAAAARMAGGVGT